MSKQIKYVKFFEKKGRYIQNRFGVVITEDKEEFTAVYCTTDNIKDARVQLATFDKKDFNVEKCEEHHAEKVLRIGFINFDRAIDSTQFDLDDLTSRRNKLIETLNLAGKK